MKNTINNSNTLNSGNSDTINNQPDSNRDTVLDSKINSHFSKYRYPKILVLHRGVEVSEASDSVINFVYHLNVLDYFDSITGHPNVYDVYLQKYQVYIEKGSLFTSDPDMVEFIIVNKIEKNTFDITENEGLHLTYKLFSDTQQIFVKYVSFTDFMGDFGSYYSVFSLFAGILSSFYNELFLDRKLITTVFKFIKNKPENNSHFFDNNIFKRKNRNSIEDDFIEKHFKGVLNNVVDGKFNNNNNIGNGKDIKINNIENKKVEEIEIVNLNKNNNNLEVSLERNKNKNEDLSNNYYKSEYKIYNFFIKIFI